MGHFVEAKCLSGWMFGFWSLVSISHLFPESSTCWNHTMDFSGSRSSVPCVSCGVLNFVHRRWIFFLPFRVHSFPYENELLPSFGAENEYFVRNIVCSHGATALRNKVVLESTFHFGFRLETNSCWSEFSIKNKNKTEFRKSSNELFPQLPSVISFGCFPLRLSIT